MPAILKYRAALLALLAVFLIPIGLSSLRGLTHVLTCADEVETPFTVIFGDGEPIVLSSASLVAGETGRLCGGLAVDIQAAAISDSEAELTLFIDNQTEYPWRGTINVALGEQSMMGSILIPVSVGRLAAGSSASETLPVRLGDGTHEFNGRLLVGP